MSTELKLVEARGTNWYEAGIDAGQQLREPAGQMVQMYREYYGNTYDNRVSRALVYVGDSQNMAPEVLQMVHGFAHGVQKNEQDIGFRDLWMLMVEELFDQDNNRQATGGGCTDIVCMPEVTGEGVIAGHTNDGWGSKDWVTAMEVNIDGQPKIFVVGILGLIIGMSLNSNGLYLGGNNLIANDVKGHGQVRDVTSWRIAAAENYSQAEEIIYQSGQASRYNNLTIQYGSDGVPQVASYEGCSTQVCQLVPHRGIITHANDYLAPDLLSRENSPEAELSKGRNDRALQLIRAISRPGIEDVWRIMEDHESSQPICRHQVGRFSTHTLFGSVVTLGPDEGVVCVGLGNPCNTQPEKIWSTRTGFKI